MVYEKVKELHTDLESQNNKAGISFKNDLIQDSQAILYHINYS